MQYIRVGDAYYFLGVMYRDGLGVTENSAASKHYFDEAVSLGVDREKSTLYEPKKGLKGLE